MTITPATMTQAQASPKTTSMRPTDNPIQSVIQVNVRPVSITGLRQQCFDAGSAERTVDADLRPGKNWFVQPYSQQ